MLGTSGTDPSAHTIKSCSAKSAFSIKFRTPCNPVQNIILCSTLCVYTTNRINEISKCICRQINFRHANWLLMKKIICRERTMVRIIAMTLTAIALFAGDAVADTAPVGPADIFYSAAPVVQGYAGKTMPPLRATPAQFLPLKPGTRRSPCRRPCTHTPGDGGTHILARGISDAAGRTDRALAHDQ